MTTSLLFLLCGGVAAFMAHRGLMIFHDASRPTVHEMMEGKISRREWLTAAWPLSYGMLLGFGLPYALASGIVMVHLLFLGTDLIGAAVPGSRLEMRKKSDLSDHVSVQGKRPHISLWFSVFAGLAGSAYAACLFYGLGAVVKSMEQWPIPLSEAMEPVGRSVVLLFSLFPVLVVYRQYGMKKGIFVFVPVAIAYWWLETQSGITFLPAAAGALSLGLIILLVLVLREKRNPAESVVPHFLQRAERLKKGYVGIFALGALYSACVAGNLLAEGPQSLLAMREGEIGTAAVIALSRAVSFLPLKSMTSLTSGTFPTDGLGLVPVVGLLANSVIPAAFFGGLVMLLEAILLVRLAKATEAFPRFQEAASHIRSSMSWLLEIGLLVGGFTSALSITGEWGALTFIGLYLFNEYTGNRLPKMSVALLGLLVVFISANAFEWIAAG